MNLLRSMPGTAVLVSALVWSTDIEAQAGGRQPFATISGGVSSTKGATFFDPGALNTNLLVGATMGHAGQFSIIGAAFGGFTSSGGHDAVCAIVAASNGHSYCVPTEPTYLYGGAMLGVTTPEHPVVLGVMAGPAFVNSACGCNANPDAQYGGNVFGVQMRAELRVHVVGPVSLTFGGHNLLIPNMNGHQLRVQSGNFGLHFQ